MGPSLILQCVVSPSRSIVCESNELHPDAGAQSQLAIQRLELVSGRGGRRPARADRSWVVPPRHLIPSFWLPEDVRVNRSSSPVPRAGRKNAGNDTLKETYVW